jgi:hypothetical protein
VRAPASPPPPLFMVLSPVNPPSLPEPPLGPRADLVEWRRRSAPDLPFYNHIMSKRIEIGVWRTNQQNYAKQANSRIDNDSEDDEWE